MGLAGNPGRTLGQRGTLDSSKWPDLVVWNMQCPFSFGELFPMQGGMAARMVAPDRSLGVSGKLD